MGTSKKKLELTFKPYGKGSKRGRWWKSIDGKRVYFGAGNGKSDRKSYAAAMANYQAFMEKKKEDEQHREQAEQLRRLSRAFYQGKLEAHLGQPEASGTTMTVEDIVDGALDDWDESPEPTLGDVRFLVREQEQKRQQQRPQEPEKDSGQMCINDHVDVWLAAERQRQKSGEITVKAVRSKEQGINTFRGFAGTKDFESNKQLEALLTRYRASLLMKLGAGAYTANTVTDKLKFLRQFIKWSYEEHILEDLPRNLSKVTKAIPTEKSGEPLSLKDVRKLWGHADSKMRCWIALGLNCGFKNSDIAYLKAEHLEKGRLIGRRGKTNVPMNYKLWPVTRDLIEQTRMDGDQDTGGLLFINAQGRPVVTDTGSDRVGHAFKKLAKRAGVDATFQQLRDTGAQAVQDISREEGQVNPALVQLYLAHKDGSTAAYYVSDDPHSMVTKPLDDILDRLDEYFKLDADQIVVERKAG